MFESFPLSSCVFSMNDIYSMNGISGDWGLSNPSPLGGPAAVVRQGRHVFDRLDHQPRRLQPGNRAFPSRAGALHANFNFLHPEFGGLFGARFGGALSGEWGTLA